MPDEEDIVNALGEEMTSPKDMHWLLLSTPEVLREWRPENGRTPIWKSAAREGSELRNLSPSPDSGIRGMGSSDRREVDDLDRLFLRQPPPTGTLRRAPPLVQ